MAEDPDARRGRFARSMMRAATMDNPPAAIHALAEAAQISAKHTNRENQSTQK